MRARRLLHLATGVALGVALLPAAASAQGTITDGGTSFAYDASSFDTTPNAAFTGVGTGDYVFEHGWWVRIAGATQETALPLPTTQSYAGATSTLSWTNLLGSGLDLVETSQVTGLAPTGTAGRLTRTMAVTNTTAAPVEFNLFNFVDLDVNGSAGTDGAVRTADGRSFRITDPTAGFAEYRAPSADAFLVRTFSATTDVAALLSDAMVTDFDNSGLPFASGDFTGGYQWRDRTIPPGETRTFTVRLTGNTPAVLSTTSTTLSSSLNPSTAGGTISLTATVSPATNEGTVQFKDGAANVGDPVPVVDGVAAITLQPVSGSHPYTAVYSGTLDVGGGVSPVLDQVVAAAGDGALSLGCDEATVSGGQVACTATATSGGPGPVQGLTVAVPLPSGTTFASVNAPGWTCATPAVGAGGTVSCTRPSLAVASSSAIQLGIGIDAARPLGALILEAALSSASTDSDDVADRQATAVVDVKAPTTTTVTSSANPATAGAPVTLTATVSDALAGTPGGTVRFRDGATDLGVLVALNGGTATLTTSALSVGSHEITAIYNGDADFGSSTSTSLTQVIVAEPGAGPGPSPAPTPVPTPISTPTSTPVPGSGGQGGAVNPGIRFAGVQKRVTLSSRGTFGLRFGATAGVPLSVEVNVVVPGTKKRGTRKATKARTVRLYAGRGIAADSRGNVAVRVTLTRAQRAKLPAARKTFAATLTVKAGGRTFTHRFTLVRAKVRTKKR